MNENAKKWVAALRSGKYKQATKFLSRKVDGEWAHCCLGVACELYIEEGNPLYVREAQEGLAEFKKYGDQNRSGTLPDEVKSWLGLSDVWGSYAGRKYKELSAANDHGRTFKQIAALIEQEPKGLFVS